MSIFQYRKSIVSTITCFLFIQFVSGQVYNFKNFGIDSKIPNTFIYSLIQGNDGYLWVGTGNGLSKFDGFDFYNIEFPDSVTNRHARVSLKDRNGTLWFGFDDGTVFYVVDNELKQLPIVNSRWISEIIEGPDGNIYILPQGEAVFKVNPVKPGEFVKYNIGKFFNSFSGCFTSDGKLLIGTDANLRICNVGEDTIVTEGIVNGFDYANLQSVKKINGDDNYIIGTEGNGLFRLTLSPSGNTLSRFQGYPELESLRIQSIFQESPSVSWISTYENGLYELYLSQHGDSILSVNHLDRNSGLLGNNVRLLYQDLEGNLWIGFFGDGLSLLTSYAFSFFTPGAGETNNIIYINQIGDEYFLGTPSGYFIFDLVSFRQTKYVDLMRLTGNVGIETYFVDNDYNIWIGTKGNGLFVTSISGDVRQVYSTGESGRDNINDVEVDDKYIWLATVNGVVILNKRSGRQVQVYNTDNGLPHNLINQIYLNDDGSAYIACESDKLYKLSVYSGLTADDQRMTDNFQNRIMSFAKAKDGTVWASTLGNGIFKCYSDSIISYSTATGLKSNYCYGILIDSRNFVWIGHEGALSKLNQETGAINIYDSEFAHDGIYNPDAMFESEDDKVFIGTTRGLLIYDFRKDKKKEVSPLNNINSVTINGVVYPYKESYLLPYSKRYNVKVSYVGVYFSEPAKVYYSTFLENYDESWSPFSKTREVPYSLVDGKYKFQVISTTEHILLSEGEKASFRSVPISFEINIQRPFWRSWWGIITMTVMLITIIIFVVRQREASQRKTKEYLEKELELRTSVMMKQKSEIELQNLAITDSINYAKRIQTSILPDINKLKETFSDAFILFYPRDIVSGDFYWFDKIDDERFVMVCADSTGHGVPGAFMSIIGSTLLQDIVTRQKVSKPSEILTMLDKEIFSTLNKNVELGVSNDGMDMVVCEYNLRNRHIRFASAMRPVIIVIDGQQCYIRGNRSSVGGESITDKFFDDQEYYLNEGDIIYMFSDGMPDQFGGTDGKKMKIARLKSLIDSISGDPMIEQQEAMMKFYNDWKGNHDQVDDVLIMGIKI